MDQRKPMTSYEIINSSILFQIIKFQAFKSRGFVVFDKHCINNLLDSLEDSKTTLSTMLTSKYVKPLRDEAAAWSLKLNEISEVLEEVNL